MKFVPLCFLLLIACSKTSTTTPADVQLPEIEITEPKKCKLVKAVYYDVYNGLPQDSVNFIYTDTLITGVVQAKPKVSYKLEYQNGRLVRKERFQPGSSVPDFYWNYSFSTEGNLLQIENPNMIREFSYASGNIQKMVVTSHTATGSYIIGEYFYTFSNGNITNVNSTGNNGPRNEKYVYDNNENLFAMIPFHYYVDPFLSAFVEVPVPYLYSKNNLLYGIVNNVAGAPHNYKKNAAGYMTEMSNGDKPFIKYIYSCN
ncbi:MAG: hypothetical protein ACO1OO_13055 [Flavisolibacter sp.]